MEIDQRAARVAWIDRRVGLDEVLIALNAQATATRCAYDSHRGRSADPKRIADCKDKVAYLQFRRVAERKSGQACSVDSQDRNVGLRVGADDLSLKLAVIAQEHLDVGSPIDYVVVRDDGHIRCDDDT